MSFTDLADKILSILPNASFGEDNEGQLIIYTDMKQTSVDDNDPLTNFFPEEEPEE